MRMGFLGDQSLLLESLHAFNLCKIARFVSLFSGILVDFFSPSDDSVNADFYPIMVLQAKYFRQLLKPVT